MFIKLYMFYHYLCMYACSCLQESWGHFHGIFSGASNSSNATSSSSSLHNYILSVYWASATLTSVGYGDVKAYNMQEKALALVAMLIGVCLYGYCLGYIAAALTNSASPR